MNNASGQIRRMAVVWCVGRYYSEVPSYFNVFGVAYIKRSFQSNSCLHDSGSKGTSAHDNKLYLESRQGQSFSLSLSLSIPAGMQLPLASQLLPVVGTSREVP